MPRSSSRSGWLRGLADRLMDAVNQVDPVRDQQPAQQRVAILEVIVRVPTDTPQPRGDRPHARGVEAFVGEHSFAAQNPWTIVLRN